MLVWSGGVLIGESLVEADDNSARKITVQQQSANNEDIRIIDNKKLIGKDNGRSVSQSL